MKKTNQYLTRNRSVRVGLADVGKRRDHHHCAD